MISVIKSTNQQYLANHNFSFKQKLQDVIENIQITSELTMIYQGHEPLEIEDNIQEYLQKISPVDRNRYLAVKLQQ